MEGPHVGLDPNNFHHMDKNRWNIPQNILKIATTWWRVNEDRSEVVEQQSP